MRRLSTLALVMLTLVIFGIALPDPGDGAQHKSPLVGTWSLVSSTSKDTDGNLRWGPKPKGIVIFADNGRYASVTMRSERPKFAANNPMKGTPDEYKAAVQGSVASYGTYTVDQAKKTYTLKIEGSTYPNLEGTESARPFKLSGDELRVTNPAPSSGGGPSELVYKRLK